MAGNVCKYKNCGRTRRKYPGLKMFHFPSDPNKSKTWILNSGATLSNVTQEELSKCLLCELHFDESDFVNPVLKKKLKACALPVPYNTVSKPVVKTPLTVKVPVKIYSRVSNTKNVDNLYQTLEERTLNPQDWIQDMAELPTTTKNMHTDTELDRIIINKQDTIIMKLKSKLQIKNKKLALQRSQTCKLKSSLMRMKSICNSGMPNSRFNFPMKWSNTIVKMQLKRKKRAWQEDEKEFALLLYRKSPSAYNYLTRMIVLPSISSIKMWIGQSSVEINNKFN